MADSQLTPPRRTSQGRVLGWGGAPPDRPAALRYTHLENVVLHVASLDGLTAVAILL